MAFSSHRPVRAGPSQTELTGSAPMKLGGAKAGVPNLGFEDRIQKVQVHRLSSTSVNHDIGQQGTVAAATLSPIEVRCFHVPLPLPQPA